MLGYSPTQENAQGVKTGGNPGNSRHAGNPCSPVPISCTFRAQACTKLQKVIRARERQMLETRIKSGVLRNCKRLQKAKTISTDQKVRGSNPLSRAKRAIPDGMALLAHCDRDSNHNGRPLRGLHRPVQKLGDSTAVFPHFPAREDGSRIPYRVPGKTAERRFFRL